MSHMSTERIGITIAAYNAQGYLARAVESVLAQTDENWQLVIVDDGSTDSTLSVAQRYADADSRITAITQENADAAAARNRGMSMLDTTWVTYLDADDELEAAYVSEMRDFLQAFPGFDYYSCNGIVIAPNGSKELHSGRTQPHEISLSDMLNGCQIINAGTLQRKAAFLESGGFDESLHFSEDYCFMLPTLAQGKRLIATNRPLYRYHTTHSGRKSSHFEADLNAFQIIETVAHTYDLSEEELKASQDGRAAHRLLMARSFWSMGCKQRQETLDNPRIDEEIKRMLLSSRRVMTGVYAERLQKALHAIIGEKKARAIWTVMYSPYRMVKPLRDALRGRAQQ